MSHEDELGPPLAETPTVPDSLPTETPPPETAVEETHALPVETETLPADDIPPAAPAPAPEKAPDSTAMGIPSVDFSYGEPNPDKEEMPKDNPDLYVRFNLPRGANPSTLVTQPVRRKPTAKEDADTPAHVAALPCDATTLNSLIEAYPSINYELGDQSRDWSYEVRLGTTLLPQGDMFTKTLSHADAKWSQRVPYGAGTLGPMRASADRGAGGPGVKLAGDQAIDRVIQHLGLGASTSIPLWHSGFWVTLRAPTLEARLELQRRLDSEKISLGRISGGLAFSNISVYVKSYLMDFALAHVVTANVRYTDAQELKDLMLSTDIPAMIWGMLTTQYPSGYPYHQPCVNDPSKCQHIVKEMIDINKIFFVDTAALTEGQLRHMANRTTRHEVKDLLAYRDQHRYAKLGVFDLEGPTGAVRMELKVPTLTEYASGGFAWVDGIVNDLQRGFGSNLQGEQRNEYILERSQVTNLCEYSHWVSKIVMAGGEEVDDVESIRKTLASISGEPTISEKYFTQVTSYIEESTIALAALPRFDCPACGKPPTEEEIKHPYLNPIEVEALFFTMGAQRIARATQ